MRSLINLLFLRGWITFLFFVITALSTLLNILQVFNGIICFSVLDSSSRISKADTTRISLPASVIDANGFSTRGLCENPDYIRLDSNFAKKCGFNESKKFGTFDCSIEGKKPRGEIRRVYKFGCNCEAFNSIIPYSQSTLTATENSAIYMDSEYVRYDGGLNSTGYSCYMHVERGVCALNSEFYRTYAIISVLLVITLYFTRIALHGVFRESVSSMHSVWWFRPILNFLRRKNFLVYCSWWVDFKHTCKRVLILNKNGKFESNLGYVQEYTLFTPKVKLNAIVIGDLNLFEIEFDGDVSQLYYPDNIEKWSFCREILTRCIEEKIPIVLDGQESHQLDPLEVIQSIYEEKVSNYMLHSNDKNELYGVKIFPLGKEMKKKTDFINSISPEEKSFLEAHNKVFFKQHRPFLLNRALNSNFKPEISDIKNSEWKIYISDVKHHILKTETKVKKYGKSRSLLLLEGNSELVEEESRCSPGTDLKNSLNDYFLFKTQKRVKQLAEMKETREKGKERILSKRNKEGDTMAEIFKKVRELRSNLLKEKKKKEEYERNKEIEKAENERKKNEPIARRIFDKPLEEILEVDPIINNSLIRTRGVSTYSEIGLNGPIICEGIKRISAEINEKYPGMEICEWCHSNKYEREITEDFNFIIEGDLKGIYNSEKDLLRKMNKKWEKERKWFYKAKNLGLGSFQDRYGRLISIFSNEKSQEEFEIRKKKREMEISERGEPELKEEEAPVEEEVNPGALKEIIKECLQDLKIKPPVEMSKSRGGAKAFKNVVKNYVRELLHSSYTDFKGFKIGLSKPNKKGISLKSLGLTKKVKSKLLVDIGLAKERAKKEKEREKEKERREKVNRCEAEGSNREKEDPEVNKKLSIDLRVCIKCGFDTFYFLRSVTEFRNAKCKNVRNPNPEWVEQEKIRRKLEREERRERSERSRRKNL